MGASWSFVETEQRLGEIPDGVSTIACGDVNSDGANDLVMASVDGAGSTIRLYLNDGAGGFSDSGQLFPATPAPTLGGTSVSSFVFLNDGEGRFARSGIELGGGLTSAVALADVDGDGDVDTIEGRKTGGGATGSISTTDRRLRLRA